MFYWQKLNKFPKTDGSTAYSKESGLFLYIANEDTKTVITFKSFLKSFSINIKGETTDEKAGDFGSVKNLKRMGITYDVGLSVPCGSLLESRANSSRMEELNRFVSKPVLPSGIVPETAESPQYVLLANLIHNGSYTSKREITSYSQVAALGLKCYYSDFNYKIDTSMGFFEKDGLWPKLFEITLKLKATPSFRQGKNDKYLAAHFTSGKYDASDMKKWPFGVRG